MAEFRGTLETAVVWIALNDQECGEKKLSRALLARHKFYAVMRGRNCHIQEETVIMARICKATYSGAMRGALTTRGNARVASPGSL
ncbi:hypothetical protein CVT25_010488 [Psilocybe cyanescens]|uniref:Uncharacterized protein n=1 Tax=Psilocybe cyanescens TaxID=93625 RepID=A0A409XDJ4_PSICY|nr:hypothetical protein CVT25_010488 [Psilocybe cyanescens]